MREDLIVDLDLDLVVDSDDDENNGGAGMTSDDDDENCPSVTEASPRKTTKRWFPCDAVLTISNVEDLSQRNHIIRKIMEVASADGRQKDDETKLWLHDVFEHEFPDEILPHTTRSSFHSYPEHYLLYMPLPWYDMAIRESTGRYMNQRQFHENVHAASLDTIYLYI
jgi:hypothetical protein